MSFNNTMTNYYRFVLGLTWIFLNGVLFSCVSPRDTALQYEYFKGGADTITIGKSNAKLKVGDKLSIQVVSRTLNQEQAVVFNTPSAASNMKYTYDVDSSGQIYMPVIGGVTAAGLTVGQLRTSVEDKIKDYVKNPTVMIKYAQFSVSVLGEVTKPGVHSFEADNVTLTDALAAAGDLTDFGRRDDVSVIREENGKKIHRRLDIRDKRIFENEFFMLQTNDIVYVAPNEIKLRTLSVDPVKRQRTGTVIGLLSLTLSIATLIVSFVNNN